MKANLEFMQVCQRALQSSSADTSEYEAVGINVGKKLEKMTGTQAIYAEALINNILSMGLLNKLTENTFISEKPQIYNNFIYNYNEMNTSSLSSTSIPTVSDQSTETISSPNPISAFETTSFLEL